jgi:hypothetical protein
MQIALLVHAFEQVAEEGWDVGHPQRGIVVLDDDEKVLRQRKLSLSPKSAGLGEQLLRFAALDGEWILGLRETSLQPVQLGFRRHLGL